MQLVTSEILADLCGLSPGPLAVGLAVGLTLWLLGWWSHRFWVVLVATVAAGGFGLFEASAHQGQPLLASLLLTGTAAVLVLIDPAEDYEPWTRGTVRIIAGLVSLGVFILLFQTFGFVVSAFLMLVLWLKVFGGESWRWALGLAAAGTAVMYLLFVELLGVPFPDGLVDAVTGG